MWWMGLGYYDVVRLWSLGAKAEVNAFDRF